MDISHHHLFDAPIDVVAALFADPAYARARGSASGAGDGEALVDGTPSEGFSVAVRQAVPASSIPPEFRGFVGSDLTVRYTEVWEPESDGERPGTFAVEIIGAPGHAAGSLRLEADGDSTRFGAAGAVTVRIPLVGPMIEKAVGSAVLKALDAELALADEWLARR